MPPVRSHKRWTRASRDAVQLGVCGRRRWELKSHSIYRVTEGRLDPICPCSRLFPTLPVFLLRALKERAVSHVLSESFSIVPPPPVERVASSVCQNQQRPGGDGQHHLGHFESTHTCRAELLAPMERFASALSAQADEGLEHMLNRFQLCNRRAADRVGGGLRCVQRTSRSSRRSHSRQ